MRLKQLVDKINNVKPVRRDRALAKKFQTLTGLNK
jgi:hypothetical protein